MPHLELPEGDRIYFEDHGAGEPVMLLAGLNGLGSFWHPILPLLSDRFRVIIHDHRGTGRSSASLIDYSVAQMTGDALALMDHLGLGSAHIVGHSTGGAMGQLMAIEAPERVRRLVLSATWTHCDDYVARLFEVRGTILRASGYAAYARSNPLFLYPPRWIRDNAALVAANDEASQSASAVAQEIMGRRIEAILKFDERLRLHRIAAPTMAIAARDDIGIPSYFTEDLGRAINGAVTVMLPEGGHFVPVVTPEVYAAAVRGFLLAA